MRALSCAISGRDAGLALLLRKRSDRRTRIGYEERGENGFGYDPIFYVPEYGRTTAELSEEEKNQVSHRARALCRVRERLEKLAEAGGIAE